MVSSFLAFTVSLAVLLAEKGTLVMAQQGNPAGPCCADQLYLVFCVGSTSVPVLSHLGLELQLL